MNPKRKEGRGPEPWWPPRWGGWPVQIQISMQWRPRQAEDNAEEREYLVVIPRTWRIWLKHSYPQGVERLVDGPVSLIDKGLNHQHHNKPEYSPGELRIARMASPCSGRLYIQRVLQREWKCTGLTANHPSTRIRARVWARSLSTWSIDTQWMVCPGHSATGPLLNSFSFSSTSSLSSTIHKKMAWCLNLSMSWYIVPIVQKNRLQSLCGKVA